MLTFAPANRERSGTEKRRLRS